ncbi:MAG: hypothetical protein RL557_969 [archaeon]|jgi:hypothetical protein
MISAIMNLELRITKTVVNGKPMEVFMNATSGFLFINRHRVFVGGYLNVTGPWFDKEPTLTFMYDRKTFCRLPAYVEKIKFLPNVAVGENLYENNSPLCAVDLIFPPTTLLAQGNYDPPLLKQQT